MNLEGLDGIFKYGYYIVCFYIINDVNLKRRTKFSLIALNELLTNKKGEE